MHWTSNEGKQRLLSPRVAEEREGTAGGETRRQGLARGRWRRSPSRRAHPGSASEPRPGAADTDNIPGSHRSLIYPNTRHGPHVIIELSVIYHRERWRMREESHLAWQGDTSSWLTGGGSDTALTPPPPDLLLRGLRRAAFA